VEQRLATMSKSVALAQQTLSTSARRLQTSLVGHTSVLLNAATCWFLAPELTPTEFSSCCTDRLELSSGTPASRHWLVADSLEMG